MNSRLKFSQKFNPSLSSTRASNDTDWDHSSINTKFDVDIENTNANSLSSLLEHSAHEHKLDQQFGYERINDYATNTNRTGWLINMHPVCYCFLKRKFSHERTPERERVRIRIRTKTFDSFVLQTMIEDPDTHQAKSCIEYYFIQEDGSTFKALIPFQPYFYVGAPLHSLREVEIWLKRKFERLIYSIEPVQKVDLEMVEEHIILNQTHSLLCLSLTLLFLIVCR
jgi:hypothetical protein